MCSCRKHYVKNSGDMEIDIDNELSFYATYMQQ